MIAGPASRRVEPDGWNQNMNMNMNQSQVPPLLGLLLLLLLLLLLYVSFRKSQATPRNILSESAFSIHESQPWLVLPVLGLGRTSAERSPGKRRKSKETKETDREWWPGSAGHR